MEKSVVSERFSEASRQKLRELIERPLGNLKLCAVMIDAMACQNVRGEWLLSCPLPNT